MTSTPKTGRAGRRLLLGALLALAVSAALGTAPFAVTRQSTSRPAEAGVRTVETVRRPTLTLAVYRQSARRSVMAGAVAVYRLRIGRRGRLVRPPINGRPRVAARVWLSVTTRLPGAVVATFDPRSTRATRTTLTLRTKANTRAGTYRLRLRARGRLRAGPRTPMQIAQTTVTLVVVRRRDAGSLAPAPAVTRPPGEEQGPGEQQAPGAFTISGSVAGELAPGVTAPLDLILTNPHPFAIEVVDLAVRLSAVHAPQADPAHPCTTGDFAVGAFSGAYGFTLPASSTTHLSAFGFTAAELPGVTMLDRPVNQDGCKRASLALAFIGTATEAHR